MTTSENDQLTEIRVAATAAAATRSVAGVARLQPGLWGLVQQLSHDLWARVIGRPYPDAAGVDVDLDQPGARVEIAIVTDGTRPANRVAGDVQRAVHRAVIEQHAITTTRVAVHIREIALPG